jgi:hypothetical protein
MVEREQLGLQVFLVVRETPKHPSNRIPHEEDAAMQGPLNQRFVRQVELLAVPFVVAPVEAIVAEDEDAVHGRRRLSKGL